ncbi:hypothetical protein Ahy_A05g022306 isoform A [Arachis hypogaea]|uniref:Uncharacterized protein n=1 Tax=Arachis hypogaea TaxID=3818 RepID=A0A445D0L0_ARAHY|nr:hypothetical protein Ahy_A05g022306 isoform A [Arachis hypogaea]
MIPSWKSGSLLSNRSVQDLKSFSSFIMAILLSSHHESLKAQKEINGDIRQRQPYLWTGIFRFGFSDWLYEF